MILNLKNIISKVKASCFAIAALLGTMATTEAFAQPTPTGSSCADAIPFCTGTTYNFPNISNGAGAPPGLGYACLATQPNAVWYYMKIANPGTLQISLNQYNGAGAGTDVDFAFWGPFTSLADGCTAISGGQLAIQSSYAGGGVQEIVSLGLPGGTGTGTGCATTPPPAQTGEYYVLLMTNWSNQPGNIVFSQTAGTASTDCSIISCGVTLTSNSPVCDNDTLKIDLANPNDTAYVYNYVWTGPGGFTSTDQNLVLTGLTAGNYVYSVDAIATLANGNFDTCTEQIEVVVNPTYHTELTEYICSGDSIDIYGTYQKIAGDYDTMLTTINGCDSLITTTLHVVARPVKIEMLDSLIVCQYDSVAIESNTLPYNAGYTYSWNPSTNLNADDQPNVWFFADQSRTYTLTVTKVDVIPCSLRDTIDIIVNPGDFLEVPVTDVVLCSGDSVQLNASGAATYKWSPALYLSNPDIANPVAKPGTTTTYTLVGTSNKNCTDTQIVHITVHPNAVLQLPDSVNIYPGESYYMQPGTNAVYFNWFPVAGLNSHTIANPMMNPTVNTRYFVTAKTEFGCEVTDSVDVYVKETVMDMPNAFNPNYERFKVSIRGIASIESFAIYNRWGQLIFETKNLNEGWDGHFKGTAQPAGVYVYKIIATTVEGKPFQKTGNVTLIR
ncbi:MAG: gliding motility-associated C-terminal domain-containing protein [Sphingobacteriales bacterium]|nr:MAG: gliding motility-associated C-terminal domain-containing protein [Sphingobacteriales bacterium]